MREVLAIRFELVIELLQRDLPRRRRGTWRVSCWFYWGHEAWKVCRSGL